MGSKNTRDSAEHGRGVIDTVLMLCLGIGSLILLGLAASSGWLRFSVVSRHPEAEGIVRGLCLGLALLAGTIAYRLRRVGLLAETGSEEMVPQPGMQWLIDLQKSVGDGALRHDFAAVSSFIELITSAARHRSRVVEAVDFEGRIITQRVSVELILPEAVLNAPALYLPVLQPIKGELIDNFALTDAGGSRLTNLSYEETTRLAAVALRLLLLDAISAFALSDDEKITELVLLDILAKRGKTSRRATASAIENALKMFGMVDHGERTERLSNYLLSLSLAYPIVAVVPREFVVANRVLLRYERTIIPTSQNEGWRGDLRLGLGIRPNQVAVSPVLALTAGSYHLLIKCPADKYVLRQKLRCRHCGDLVTRRWHGAVPKAADGEQVLDVKDNCCHTANPPNDDVDCHYRLRRRRGQNYVHLYMRGYANAEAPLRGLQMLVQLKEVPPGSRGQAAVTSLATTVLIGMVGYLISHREIVPNSDLPALALSLPAVAASWFGFAGDGKNLTGSSLLARISLIISGALSVGAIVVYLSEVPRIVGQSGQAPAKVPSVVHQATHFAFLGVTNSIWLALLVMSSVNFIYILWRFTIKVRVYSAMLQKEDKSELEYSNG